MNDIEKALLTWYAKDHPLHSDPLHPAIKLAGEAGELLDLYGKERFKPQFSWWQCKNCGEASQWDCRCDNETLFYTPLVLDETGDYTYYLRIICYIADISLEQIKGENYYRWSVKKLLAVMGQNSYTILNDYLDKQWIDVSRLKVIWGCLEPFISELGVTWQEIIDLNYRKLNSEPTAHGWRKKS
jgi:hypothetical protein